MKENVLDVLIYLFETYANTNDQQDHSENQLLIKLRSAGFSHIEIDRAMDWLDSLVQIENKFHLKVIIKSKKLKSMNKIMAHKEIFSILKDEMSNKIHALEIEIQ